MGQTYFSLRSLTMLASLIVIPAIALSPPDLPRWTNSVVGLLDTVTSKCAKDDKDRHVAVNQAEDVHYVHPSMANRSSGRAGLPPPRDRNVPPSLRDDETYSPRSGSTELQAVSATPDRPYVAQRQPASVEDSPSPGRSPRENAEEEVLLGQLTSRLRDLGASYYRLEAWGQTGEMFLFQCRVQRDGSSEISRHFQVADSRRLQAVRRVVEQVEAWNANVGRTSMFGAQR